MWTPATAVLWECWRLSRRSLAILMLTAAFGGAALIVSPLDGDWSARLALVLAGFLALCGQAWAQNLDSRTGFTMRLGFTRPIPTWVLVSVPMAYISVSCAAIYLVPMIALRAVFGIPFPLLPVAALVSTLSLAFVARSWWTGDSVRQRVALAVLWLFGWFWYFGDGLRENNLANSLAPDRWLEIFSFSAAAYGWMLFISAAALGVAIAGVTRQRRGDDGIALAQLVAERADPGVRPTLPWIAERFGLRCPVTSSTGAQLWFEMCTVGGRVLTAGALVAVAGPLFLTALSASGAGGEMLVGLSFWGFVLPLMAALPSMLGVRRKQGASYLTACAATRALGTARLVGLKVLVTSLTLLVAWVAIGASFWVFAVRFGAWGPYAQDVFADYFPSTPGIADVLVIIVSVGVWVAAAGALHAFYILNGRRVLLAGFGLGLYIAFWVLAGIQGWVGGDTIWIANVWIVTLTVVLGTAYLLRRLIAERIFTSRGLVLVAGIWVGFALMALWVHLEPNDDFVDRVAWFVIAVLPLTAAALAPWSFSRLRHQ